VPKIGDKTSTVIVDPYAEVSKAAMRDAQALMSNQHDPMALPPLGKLIMDIQGQAGAFKTTLVAGDPRLYLMKTPDGNPIIRRCLSHVELIRLYKDLMRTMDNLLEYAHKHGGNGRWCAVGLDSASMIQHWVVQEELRKYNAVARCKWAAMEGKKEDFEPALTIQDTGMPSMYGDVRQFWTRFISQFQSAGWGVRLVTHYHFKLQYTKPEKGRARPDKQVWQPDLFESSASEIAKMSDCLVVCRRIGAAAEPDCKYYLEFTSDTRDDYGSRIPMGLEGAVEVLNYSSAPDDYVAWQALEGEHYRACKVWLDDQKRFRRARRLT